MLGSPEGSGEETTVQPIMRRKKYLSGHFNRPNLRVNLIGLVHEGDFGAYFGQNVGQHKARARPHFLAAVVVEAVGVSAAVLLATV